MAAGAAKRFEMRDENMNFIPKPLAPIDGMPNLARTVLLVQKESPSTEIFISMPPEKIDKYKEEISKHCDGFTAFCGVSVEDKQKADGYKFPNIKDYIVPDTVVLYGDCRYEESDIAKALEENPAQCSLIGIRRDPGEPSCIGKRYQEHYVWRIFDVQMWHDIVDKTFKQKGESCMSHDVWKAYPSNKKIKYVPSKYTDDFDYLKDYNKLIEALNKRDGVPESLEEQERKPALRGGKRGR